MQSLRQSVRELVRLFRDDSFQPARVDLLDLNAQERAIQLLKQNLSVTQRVQYRMFGHFEVTGCDTGRRYRIRQGKQMNIELQDRMGARTYLLCFMPKGHLPVGDIMLAQKIALELFESEALRIANKSLALEWFLDVEQRAPRRRSRDVT